MAKNRKIEIIKTAEKRFIKHGLNKTTLDEIARDLRLGKSTIYHYFESKEELFYETIKNEIKEYTDGINLLLNSENGGPIQSLKLYFQNKAALKTKFPLVFQMFLLIISGRGNEIEIGLLKELVSEEENKLSIFFQSFFKENKPAKLSDTMDRKVVDISNYFLVFTELNEKTDPEHYVELLDKEIVFFLETLFP